MKKLQAIKYHGVIVQNQRDGSFKQKVYKPKLDAVRCDWKEYERET